MDESDLRHLERCLELAEEALVAGDEPFGSVLVSAAGEMLHEDRNRETTAGDPTAHPELALAQWAGQHLTREERAGATVFTSGEHCPMCAAAHAWVGLGRIVFASSSEQMTQWRDELGLGASPVAPLSIQDVVPDLPVEGPSVELAPLVRDLHRRRPQH